MKKCVYTKYTLPLTTSFIILPCSDFPLHQLIHFLPDQTIGFLSVSLLFLLITLLLHFKLNNTKVLYSGLFISIMLAGFGFALTDDFLHPWDEQFHALVARNLMNHPLHPTLIENIPNRYDYKIWIYNYTWLHKQPLFLWQIALSLKLFGTNLIALRLPSIIMYAASACLVLSISKRFLNRFFAILAAVLFGYCGFSLDFISGVQGMDHNDIAFLFYVTASFWSWMKYEETKRFRYLVFIGLFSGGAVLCKWLTGLIVFAGWGAVILFTHSRDKQEWKNIFIAFGFSLLVFVPWQLYCLIYFPVEYKHELTYNSAHFFSAVENHGGSWNFYFDGMKKIYGSGDLMRIIVLTGLLFTAVNAFAKKNAAMIFGVVVFVAVYAFFMLAATKLHGYVLIVSSFGFIFLVTPFYLLSEWVKKKKTLKLNPLLFPFLIIGFMILHFHSKGVIDRHNFRAPETTDKWKNALVYSSDQILNSQNKYHYYLIKNADTPIVPALRFMTGKIVFGWHKDLENPNALVIDLDRQ